MNSGRPRVSETENAPLPTTNGPPVLGLIGGIGSGKSRVAQLLAERGGRIVSGDEAGHEALRRPEIRERLVRQWGRELLDERGEIQRRKLGAIVFADASERRTLEAIVFPWIKKRLREQIEDARCDPQTRFIVLDAAVLLEAGWDDVCDRIAFVLAPREVRLARVQQRGWTEAEMEAREQSQLPLEVKAAQADDVVDNSGSMEQLNREVDRLVEKLTTNNR